MCHKYGLKFEELKDFGIRQNSMDKFRGEEIAILYDPGMFPALLTDEKGKLNYSDVLMSPLKMLIPQVLFGRLDIFRSNIISI